MDLLEYQAKKLFRQVGIPILPAETIANPRELKQLQIPYPVVLKSQVKAGGRGKAGGVKFVTNTIDAIAAARNIFNLSILGEYPEVVLAEARYNAQKELFLAIVLDYQLQCPVIFGSICGGMDIERLVENLQQVVIETEFSSFLARRLAFQMGLNGDLLLSVSNIVEKMYRLFRSKDLDFIEINPLGVDSEGNLMALDGKITVSDAALDRHPELVNLSISETDSTVEVRDRIDLDSQNRAESGSTITALSQKTAINWLDWQNSKGKIAILTNDCDLTLLVWDLIRQQKEKPACGVVINDLSTPEQLQKVLEKLQLIKRIKVLLINFWGTETQIDAIAKLLFQLQSNSATTPLSFIGEENIEIGNYHRNSKKTTVSSGTNPLFLKLVVRLPIGNIELYQQEFANEDIYWTNDLEDAVDRAIALSKIKS